MVFYCTRIALRQKLILVLGGYSFEDIVKRFCVKYVLDAVVINQTAVLKIVRQ